MILEQASYLLSKRLSTGLVHENTHRKTKLELTKRWNMGKVINQMEGDKCIKDQVPGW